MDNPNKSKELSRLRLPVKETIFPFALNFNLFGSTTIEFRCNLIMENAILLVSIFPKFLLSYFPEFQIKKLAYTTQNKQTSNSLRK